MTFSYNTSIDNNFPAQYVKCWSERCFYDRDYEDGRIGLEKQNAVVYFDPCNNKSGLKKL